MRATLPDCFPALSPSLPPSLPSWPGATPPLVCVGSAAAPPLTGYRCAQPVPPRLLSPSCLTHEHARSDGGLRARPVTSPGSASAGVRLGIFTVPCDRPLDLSLQRRGPLAQTARSRIARPAPLRPYPHHGRPCVVRKTVSKAGSASPPPPPPPGWPARDCFCLSAPPPPPPPAGACPRVMAGPALAPVRRMPARGDCGQRVTPGVARLAGMAAGRSQVVTAG